MSLVAFRVGPTARRCSATSTPSPSGLEWPAGDIEGALEAGRHAIEAFQREQRLRFLSAVAYAVFSAALRASGDPVEAAALLAARRHRRPGGRRGHDLAADHGSI